MRRLLPFLVLVPAIALAKANGIATTSCSGCHGGGVHLASVTLTGPSASVSPGQTVTLTITFNGAGVNVGGFYLTSYAVGAFTAGSGERLNGEGISHSTPKSASNGTVTFDVQWTAPSAAGGADFDVAVVGGNGNNSDTGDQTGTAHLSFVWGCTGMPFCSDFDGDGHGNPMAGTHERCMPMMGLASACDDCDDNDERVYPGATEACNGRDDNCNGQIDEGLAMTTTWPDVDGDDYGDPRGATQMGCATAHRAANNLDCDDSDPNIHPGAPEICDERDDNCNGEIDEGVQARCGTGWCARLSPTCDVALCMPGDPRPEVCNAFDDDCDGVIDNGELCGPNGVCYEGECYAGDAPLPDAGQMMMMMPGADAGPAMDGGGSGCASSGGLAAWLALLALVTRQRHSRWTS
jgi:hypothetical protein